MVFPTLDNARQTIENWRLDYNQVRPHSSLGYLTQEEFRMGHAEVETALRFPPPDARRRRDHLAAKLNREHSYLPD